MCKVWSPGGPQTQALAAAVDEWAGGLGRGTDASARDGIALLLTLTPPPQPGETLGYILG